MTLAQASLYPLKRQKLSLFERKELLSQLKQSLGEGSYLSTSTWNKLVTPELEISLSELGCGEVFGDIEQFRDLIPRFIQLAFSFGYSYNWLFLDPVDQTKDSTKIREKVIKHIQLQKECKYIHIGGNFL
jgi:hypothetical protein